MLRPQHRSLTGGSTALLASVFLAGCPRSTPPAKTQAKTRPSHTLEVQDTDTFIGGSYECRLRTGSDDLAGPCVVSSNGEAFDIQLQLGNHQLSGSALRTSYGLRFEGTLNQEPVTADLIRQGDRSFGAVLQLADKSLYKLDVSPAK